MKWEKNLEIQERKIKHLKVNGFIEAVDIAKIHRKGINEWHWEQIINKIKEENMH